MQQLQIRGLCCEAEGKPILRGVDLTINRGDMIALLGPNGHGKSTLLNCLMGSPHYKVTAGSVTLDGEDLLALRTDERSKKGFFLAFQTPPDVPGVVTMDFFRGMINAHREKPVSLFEFYKKTTAAYKDVGLDSEMASRHLNEGYSGGEKKRNEILQMLLLHPSFAMLDEIDSGLDVDALSLVAKSIQKAQAEGTTFLLISHYDRLLEAIRPNRTAVMVNGRIALEGDYSLAQRIAKEGYSFLERENGIDLKKTEEEKTSIGVCGAKVVK